MDRPLSVCSVNNWYWYSLVHAHGLHYRIRGNEGRFQPAASSTGAPVSLNRSFHPNYSLVTSQMT